LKFKELGFNKECLSLFRDKKFKQCECIRNSDNFFIAAPLWQQAIEFLNEKVIETHLEVI